MTITKEEFFKPGKVSREDKASAIDQAAKQIMAREAAQRANKTERLRKLREARESDAPAPSPSTRKARASSSKRG